MSTLAIHNGRVIDPALGWDGIADVVIVDGKIARVGPNEGDMVVEADRIDATGLIVSPGFVDLQTHLREPGFKHQETINSGTLAAARGGFTTVCAMPGTIPPMDSRSAVESVLREAEESALIRILPIGCITVGRNGERLAPAGELKSSGVVALTDDGKAVADPNLMRHALQYSTQFNIPIAQHPEDPSLVKGGQMHEGWVATRLGLRGRPASGEATMVARDIALAELTGAHLHVCNISTASSVGLIRAAKERSVNITTSVTPHHLNLTHESVAFNDSYEQINYRTNAKVEPPLREEEDIQSLVDALADGVIDAIASDHSPVSAMEKDIEFDLATPGISSIETAFALSMNLVHQGNLDISTLIHRMTVGPVKAWNLDRQEGCNGLGTLMPGDVGDVAIIDPNLEWTVNSELFASLGKNTPLNGRILKGLVIKTIFYGEIVNDSTREQTNASE